MKSRFPIILLALGSALSASAATLTWDTAPGTVGAGNGAITSGNGAWNLTATNGVWTADAGANNIAWTNGNDATFNGGGTITFGADALTAGTVAVNGTTETVWDGSLVNLTATQLNVGTTAAGKLKLTGNGSLSNITNIAVAAASSIYVDGTTTLSSAITLAGSGNNENRGALRLDNGAVVNGTITLTGNSTFGNSGGTSTSTINSAISGNFAFNRATTGTATINLTGNNTYTGGTTIGTGIVGAGHNNAFGTGTITQNGGTLSSNSTTARVFANAYAIGGNITLGNATNTGKLTFGSTSNLGGATRTLTMNSEVEFSGVVSNGGIIKAGTGQLTFSNANTYTGDTTLNGGRNQITNTAGFGTGNVIVASGAQAWVNVVSGSVINNFTISGDGFNEGGVSRGSLRLSGGTLAGNVTLAANARISGAGVEAGTIAGNIGDGGSGFALEVGGTGGNNLVALTLAGTNTYTGATTVTTGALRVNGSLATGSAVTVAAAGTLGGTGTIGGAINVSGTISPGDVTSTIQSLATGSLSLLTGSTFAYGMANTSATGADIINITGNLGLTGIVNLGLTDTGVWSLGDKLTLMSYTGTWNGGLFSFADGNDGLLADGETFKLNGTDWQLDYNDNTKGSNFNSEATGNYMTMTAVPEASSIALLGSLAMFTTLRRRRA